MSEQKYILSGIDLSALTSVSQEQIMQAINGAEPLANIGFVYVGTSRPDITNNPEMIRFLWLDITDPAAPVFKRYIADRTVLVDADLSWTALGVASGAITTAMLAARSSTGGVTIGHIKTNSGYTDAGNAYYLLRVASNGKDVEAVLLDTALADGGGVALARIATTGIGSGKFLGYNAGALGWVPIVPATDLIGSARVVVGTNIVPGTAYQVARTNSGASALEYVSPDGLFVAGSQELSLNKLATTGASANDLIRYSGSAWEKVTPTLRLTAGDTVNSGIISGSTVATGVHTIAHNLGSIPKMVRVVLRQVNAVADIGWNQNDEVDLHCYRAAGTANSTGAFGADATNVTVTFGSATGELPNKATGAWAGVDETKWYPVVYAWK